MIGGDSVGLSTLTLSEDCVIAAVGDSGFQIDPAAMENAGDTTSFFGYCTKLSDELIKVASEFGALQGIPSEQVFKIGMLRIFSGIMEAVFAVFTDFDQLIKSRGSIHRS